MTTRYLDRFLAGHGVTVREFHLLLALDENPATQALLCKWLHLDAASVSRVITRLEASGAVGRASRRRQTPWTLTPAGIEQLEDLRDGWDRVDKEARFALGGDLVPPLLARAHEIPLRFRHHGRGWSD